MKPLRIICGLFVWLGLAGMLYWSVTTQVMSQGRSVKDDLVPALWSHAFDHHPQAQLKMEESLWTSIGDPIFIIHADDSFTQVGEITAMGEVTGLQANLGAYTRQATAKFYPHAPALHSGARLTFYETPFSTEWIVSTMLPPERRKLVVEDIRQTFEAHSEEILTALRPIVEQSLREAVMAVEAELPKVLAKHEANLAALGGKYQAEILEKKLLPLVKEEIFPMAMERAKPVANTIGQKLWDRVSVWRFGVRFLWDQTPFADGENVKREFARFLKEDAIPIVEAHTADLVAVLQNVVSDAAKSKKIQAVFRESVSQVVEDKDLQKVVWAILRDAVLENQLVHEVIDRHWRGPKAKAAFALAGDKLEPMVIRIGDMLMGTRETGISPELARVLRYRLLHKDSRYYVLDLPKETAATKPEATPTLPVKMGGQPRVHPFVPLKKQP